MKNPLDVFDFNEEDNEAELVAAKYSSKLEASEAADKYRFLQSVAHGQNVEHKKICDIPRVDVDTINRDCSNAFTTSFAFLDGEDCDFDMSALDAAPQMASCSAEQLPQYRASKVEPENSCSQMGGIVRSKVSSHANVKFKCLRIDSLFSDESSDGVPGADESLSERSPSTSSSTGDDDVPFDDPSADHWSASYAQMVDGELGVTCVPDYIVYRDKYLTNSVITFSSRWIKIKGSSVLEETGTFAYQWRVDDVINIESQWCEGVEMAMVKIHVISQGFVPIGDLHGTQGVEELKFAFVGDWCGIHEAIISKDVYKPLWKNVLDSEMKCNTEVLPGKNGVLLPGHYFPTFDKPFEDLIYPKGDPDAVSLSKRDIDLLQPDTFVNDTIIDFYIIYLKNKIEPDERHRFQFFNSFFFRKLADLDKNPSSAVEGRAGFQRVRKWTRKINLFEKDYLFIPVNFNYHWSLIVICHPGEVAVIQDADMEKSLKVPCILHMDSIRGTHSGLKSLLQSYLWEEWKERHKDSSEVISSRFSNLRFLSLELPQQQNSYDCGLFLLHYVELFLEGVPVNFNPFQLTKFNSFLTADWFQPIEASLKRTYIQRMIYDLLDNGSIESSPGARSRKEFKLNCTSSSVENETSVKGYLAERCTPSKADSGNAFSSQSGQGVDLSLLPSSLKGSHCTRDSGMVYRELGESGTVGSFYQCSEQSAPLNESETSMLPIEGKKETHKQCDSPAVAQSGLPQLVAMSQESSHYICTEFRGEPSCDSRAAAQQIVPEEIKSLLESSTCVIDRSLDIEVVDDGLGETNFNFKANTQCTLDQVNFKDNKECLMDCLGSDPSKILDQVFNNNAEHTQCTTEDTDSVSPYRTTLLESPVQDHDTEEEGTKTSNIVPSFCDDPVLFMNELHRTKRRKLVSLEGLQAKLERDLHL